MEMCSLQTVALIAAVAAASFTPVCPQFCPTVDQNCQETTSDWVRSRWETSVSPLIQDMDQFQVSSKKLMGTSDFLVYLNSLYLQNILSISNT